MAETLKERQQRERLARNEANQDAQDEDSRITLLSLDERVSEIEAGQKPPKPKAKE